MEPTILSTIIWGVVWLFAGHALTGVIFWVTAMLGAVIGGSGKNDHTGEGFFGGVILGWVLGVAWEIFVIVQVVIHAVTLVQLIIAGA